MEHLASGKQLTPDLSARHAETKAHSSALPGFVLLGHPETEAAAWGWAGDPATRIYFPSAITEQAPRAIHPSLHTRQGRGRFGSFPAAPFPASQRQ